MNLQLYSHKSPDAVFQDFKLHRNEFGIDFQLQLEKYYETAKYSYNLWHYKLRELNSTSYKDLRKQHDRIKQKIRRYLKC